MKVVLIFLSLFAVDSHKMDGEIVVAKGVASLLGLLWITGVTQASGRCTGALLCFSFLLLLS